MGKLTDIQVVRMGEITDFETAVEFYNSITDSVIIIDRLLKLKGFNDAYSAQFRKEFGTEPEIGSDIYERLSTEEVILFGGFYQRALGGERFSVVIEKNGSSYDFFFNPVKNKDEIVGVSVLQRNNDLSGEISYLKESDHSFRHFIDNIQEGVVYLGADDNLIFANEHFFEMTGFSMGELSGENFYKKLFAEEDIDILKEKKKERIEGKSDEYEIRFFTREGKMKWGKVTVGPVFSTTGQFNGSLATFTDITRQKEAEKEIRERERQIRSLIENTNDSIWSVDKNGNLLTFNSTFAAFIKSVYNIELREGMGYKDLPEEKDRATWKDLYRRALKGERFKQEINYRIHGKLLFFELLFNPVFDTDDSIYGVSVFSRNITEAKKLQEEITTEKNKLREYLDVARTIFLLLNTDGTVRFINKYGLELLEEENIDGGKWIDFIPSEEKEEIQQIIDGILTGKISAPEFYENEIVNRSGKKISIVWSTRVLKDDKGNVTGILSSGINVTEKRKAEIFREIALNISEKTNRRIIDIPVLAKYTHSQLSRILGINCFYLAISEKNQVLEFPYYFNDRKEIVSTSYTRKSDIGLPEYILHHGRSGVFSKSDITGLVDSGEVEFHNQVPEWWMGALLKAEGKRVGVLVIQSFEEGNQYTEKDLELLEFVARHIGIAIERQLTQDAVVKSEEYFRTLIEYSSELILILNDEGIISYASNSSESLLGIKNTSLIGEGIDSLAFKNDIWEFFYDLKNVPGPTKNFTLRIRNAAGEIRYFSATGNNLLYDNLVRGFIINAHDITEKRKVEIQLTEVANGLKGSYGQDFFDKLTESIGKSLKQDVVFVGEYSRSANNITAVSFWNKGKFLRNYSFNLAGTPCETVLEFGEGLVIKKNIEQYYPDSAGIKRFKLNSYIGVPVYNENKNVSGVLFIGSSKEVKEPEIKKSLLSILADRISGELLNLRSQRSISVLNSIDKAIISSKSAVEIAYEALLHISLYVKNFDRASVLTFNREKNSAHVIAAIGASSEALPSGKTYSVTDFRIGKKLAKANIFRVPDLKKVKHPSNAERKLLEDGIRSYVSFALTTKGILIGTLNISSHYPEFYKDQELESLLTVCDHIAIGLHDSIQDEALRKSESENRAMLDMVPDTVIRYSPDGVILGRKQGSVTLFKKRPKQIVGMKVADLYPPKVAGQIMKTIQLALSTGKTQIIEITDGSQVRVKKVYEGRFVATENKEVMVLFSDITDRKIFEEELRFSEDVLNSVGSLVIVGDSKGSILYISPSVKNVLGYEPAELIQNNWWKTVFSEGSGEVKKLVLSSVRNNSGTFLAEHSMKCSNGEMRWILWEYRIDEQGMLVGVGQNITERKLTENELSQNTEITRMILENIGEVVYSVTFDNLERNIEFISPQVKKLLGYDPVQYAALSKSGELFQYVYPDDLARVKEISRKLSEGSTVTGSYRIRHKVLNKFVWIEETVVPRFDREGVHIGNFGTMRDITAAMNSTEQLRLLDSAINSTTDGVIITDPNLKENPIVYVNPAFENLTGFYHKEIIGKNLNILAGKNTSEGTIKEIELAFRSKSFFDGELLAYNSNGTPFWIYLTISPVFNEKKDLTHFVGVIKDITAKKSSEELLKQKNNEMNNFVYKASHDIRGPLASIIGLTNLAISRIDEPEAGQYFQLIRESTIRLDKILQDLLEISRITHASLQTSPVDIKKLAEEVKASLSHRAKEIRLEIRSSVKKKIVSDSKILVSVIQNLVDNSIKYSDRSKTDPFVKMTLKETQNGILIRISDNGIGIPAKLQSKVFDMFFRATDKSSGTGLGLYIVKNSLNKIKGEIQLESTYGKGTTFVVHISDLSGMKV